MQASERFRSMPNGTDFTKNNEYGRNGSSQVTELLPFFGRNEF
jgi:hypothetical protein